MVKTMLSGTWISSRRTSASGATGSFRFTQ